jgi:hypothetical protein
LCSQSGSAYRHHHRREPAICCVQELELGLGLWLVVVVVSEPAAVQPLLWLK